MGYTGGLKKSPTYRDLGDHTEAVQLDYDPRIITYKELLDIFWDSHEPSTRSFSRQYMDAVFYHDSDQHDIARTSKSELERETGITVETAILPINSFTMAEDYHQKYMLKANKSLNDEMAHLFPHPSDFINSTAVTRLNGYAGGHGSRDQLQTELNSLGLSLEGKDILKKIVHE